MKVELSERARARVEQLVEAGTYSSAEAAVDAAVRLLDDEARPPTSAEIAAAAERGRADFAAGRFLDGDSVARGLLESPNCHLASATVRYFRLGTR
jgi:Arc/MetJ-type ribon-helix-helix transcriptional regulator